MSTNQCKHFEFRLFGEGRLAATRDAVEKALRSVANYAVFQLEEGEQNGTKHWQGHFIATKKTRATTLKANIGLELSRPFHSAEYLAPTAKGDTRTWASMAKYSSTSTTRVAGTVPTWIKPDVYVPVHLRVTPRPWQQEVLMSADKPWDRTINCIVDEEGCSGKSTCCGLVGTSGKGFELPDAMENAKEIIQFAYSMIQHTTEPKLIVYDMTRSRTTGDRSVYAALEMIKNGMVYDTRYSGKQHRFDPPAVWVFTNKAPNKWLLSADRWKYWKIVDERLHEVFWTKVKEGDEESWKLLTHREQVAHWEAERAARRRPRPPVTEEVEPAATRLRTPSYRELLAAAATGGPKIGSS